MKLEVTLTSEPKAVVMFVAQTPVLILQWGAMMYSCGEIRDPL